MGEIRPLVPGAQRAVSGEPESLQRGGLTGIPSALGRTRLRTLITLRWLAIMGQASALVFVEVVLGFDFPFGAALAVVAASAWLNVILMAIYPAQHLSRPAETAGQLAFDVVQLATLIGLTGGLQNPFLLMLLAPVTVGAARLSPPYAMLLSGLAIACAAAMPLFALDVPWREGEQIELPQMYQAGQFIAVVIGLAFFAISASRTGRDESRLVSALDAVEAVLAREQRLSALGALAAATAHELGTPLATIHLAAKDLGKSVPKDHPAHDDIALIIEQSERCRAILRQLSERREAADAAYARMTVSALIEEASEPHRDMGRELVFTSSPLSTATDRDERAPIIVRRPEIIHALGAFVENSTSFAASRVEVSARWSESEVRIYVSDDGPGFAPSVLAKLGEPYFSERSIEQRGGGLGLGFFIAVTLLERTGARVSPYNKPAPERGAVVRISWPRHMVEAGPGWSGH
ncbi:ActS/PrrB/RegB family redox-sensitive histidine kinase [bacterium]|nr:ActS/PrrB/RegB family redox-sensitive histidine kinase [bacterium]